MDAKRWAKYPVRTCYTMHECEICEEDIVDGQTYHDGGHGRRAHTTCVVPLPVQNTIKSANATPIFASRHGRNREFGKMDIDFSAVDFPNWRDLFSGLEVGDAVRVTMTFDKVPREVASDGMED